MLRGVPFKGFVKVLLCAGERFPSIIEKLNRFEFHATEDDIKPIYEELINTLSPAIKNKLENSVKLDISNPDENQWLKQLGIFEFYDFLMRRHQTMDEKPEYFKWCNDCLWILSNNTAMSLVNIFIFNNEPDSSISDIISFKYRKKIGVKSFELYKTIFWNTSSMTAVDALYFYKPFRKNTLVIRSMKAGVEIGSVDDSSDDGSELSVVFHDSEYIKWKIGYQNVTVPGPNDFLDKVMRDSYFKYYEAMNMLQSIEEEIKNGTNEKFGDYGEIRRVKRNVEEQRAKSARMWLDIFLRAKKYKSGDVDDDVLRRINSLTIGFVDEKLLDINKNQDIVNDIKGDL